MEVGESVIEHPPTGRCERAVRDAPDGLSALLISLGALGILGAGVQLAGPGSAHLLPWVATGLLAVAAALQASPGVGRPGRRGAAALSLVVLASATTAIVQHLGADPGTPAGWFSHSWYGGGSTALAPGLLGQSALLLLVAGLRPGPRMGRIRRRVGRRMRSGERPVSRSPARGPYG